MKQVIILTSIALLGSCVDQGYSKVEYTIFNQTDKSVKVLGFNKLFKSVKEGKADPIIISPKSEFKIIRETGIDDGTIFAFYSIKYVDSVRVVFNNNKVKIYDPILGPCTICYGNDDYQHFITEQDYESAEPCEGDCE